jgi:hypothetical protein
MELLINKAKVATFLQVAIGTSEPEFNKLINEAQIFDLKPLMCEEFFNDLMKNKTEEKYVKLIDGCEYVYNGIDYKFIGLDGVLSYFTYARHSIETQNVSTTHGMVQKTTPFSTPVPLEDRRNAFYQRKSEAGKLMQDVILFIKRNPDIYPLWNYQAKCTPSSTDGLKTYVIP